MKLQVAMDVATLEEALTLARQVADHVDIIELGTSLIRNEGGGAISAIKSAHPDKLVLADMMCVDACGLEADDLFDAGADLVSVLVTAVGAVEIALESGRRRGKQVVADLMSVEDDRVQHLQELSEKGVAFCEISGCLNEMARADYSIDTLLVDGQVAEVPFSVVGGIDVDTIRTVRDAGATAAVVGGAIRHADDPAAAAKELREAIDG